MEETTLILKNIHHYTRATWNVTPESPGAYNQSPQARSVNNSNVTYDDSRNEELAKLEIAFQGVILALAIIGNICVLIALARGRKGRSRMHMFIMHLSIADLLVAFFNILPQLIWDISYRFEGGDFLCRFVKFMQVFVMYLSTYVLVMTAVDRYRAICHPLSTHTMTTKTANFMVFGAYLISGFLSIPQGILFKYQKVSNDSNEYDCWVHFDPPWMLEFYITAFTIAVYVIPLMILIFTYGSICYTIWKKHQFTRTSVAKKDENGVKCQLVYEVDSYSTCNTGTKNDKFSGKQYRKCKNNPYPRTHSVKGFSKAKLKTIKLTFVVILAYILCWSPFFISQIWWLYDETAANNDAVVIMLLLASLNSCCNPWIYLAFSGNLLKHLIPCFDVAKGTGKRNPTWSHSNSATDTKHKAIEMDRFTSKNTIIKRMESLGHIFSTKKKDTTAEDSSSRRSIHSEKSSSRSDENSRSPHVKKRARVHERLPEEILEAQLKWDQCIGEQDTLQPGMSLVTDISDDECMGTPEI